MLGPGLKANSNPESMRPIPSISNKLEKDDIKEFENSKIRNMENSKIRKPEIRNSNKNLPNPNENTATTPIQNQEPHQNNNAVVARPRDMVKELKDLGFNVIETPTDSVTEPHQKKVRIEDSEALDLKDLDNLKFDVLDHSRSTVVSGPKTTYTTSV